MDIKTLQHDMMIATSKARDAIASHPGYWALYLDTGHVADATTKRLGMPGDPAQRMIASKDVAGVVQWHAYKEIDSKFREVGVIMAAPLNEDGQFMFDAMGQIAGQVNTRHLR